MGCPCALSVCHSVASAIDLPGAQKRRRAGVPRVVCIPCLTRSIGQGVWSIAIVRATGESASADVAIAVLVETVGFEVA